MVYYKGAKVHFQNLGTTVSFYVFSIHFDKKNRNTRTDVKRMLHQPGLKQ